MIESAGQKYYLHYDGLGSVTEVTDSAANIIEKYKYGVYGSVFITDVNDQPLIQSAIGNNRLFTGREYDPETGLYFYRARYYSPELGRFLQVDPIDNFGLSSLYDYCYNAPTRWVDPLGSDTYIVNINLITGRPSGYYDPLSHTFSFTTDEEGGEVQVEHTYSWGDEESENGERSWRRDDPEDVNQAREALRTGRATKIADEVLDDYLEEAYPEREAEDQHKWLAMDNCKHQTKELLEDAIETLGEDIRNRSYEVPIETDIEKKCNK